MLEAIERIRNALANRADTEHEVAIFRLALIPVVAGFFILTGLQAGQGLMRWINALCLVYGVFAVVMLQLVLDHAEISANRRVVAILADQTFFTGVLAALGEEGAPFLSMFLLVSIDNALRYGRRYGYFASFAGAVGFLSVYAMSDFWHASGKVGLSWLIAMLVVPPYVWTFSQRIKRIGHRYRRRARKMARVAFEDPLTGLANRAAFNQYLNRAFTAAQLSRGRDGFAVLYIDLDGFKAVNDTHGHAVGDVLLKEVARTLKQCVRGTDHLARLGGDEFAIILNNITDSAVAKRIGAHIVDRVQQISQADGHEIDVSCSVGLAMSPDAPQEGDLERVLAAADEAMYDAKRAGKNQLAFRLTPSV